MPKRSALVRTYHARVIHFWMPNAQYTNCAKSTTTVKYRTVRAGLVKVNSVYSLDVMEVDSPDVDIIQPSLESLRGRIETRKVNQPLTIPSGRFPLPASLHRELSNAGGSRRNPVHGRHGSDCSKAGVHRGKLCGEASSRESKRNPFAAGSNLMMHARQCSLLHLSLPRCYSCVSVGEVSGHCKSHGGRERHAVAEERCAQPGQDRNRRNRL